MAEILGVAGSVIGILQLTGKLVSWGYEYIEGVKDASEDLRQLISELLSLSNVLLVLQGYIQDDKKSTTLQILNGHNGPIPGCMLELKRLQLKLEPKTGLQGKKKCLMWPLKEKETMKHISQLERHKGLFALALTADQLMLSNEIEKYVQDTNLVVHNLQAESSAQASLSKAIEGYAQDTNMIAHNIQTEYSAQNAWMHKIQNEARRKTILNWLSPDDFDSRHLEISGKRQRNTGQWLLQEPRFKNWIDKHPDFLLLWGHGIPGAGKTFLSSMVIDHLQVQSPTASNGVAYIYFDYMNQDRQKPTYILATLIKQLASQVSHSESCLAPEIEKLYNTLQPKEKKPTWEELYTTLLAISKKFNRVFLVFDALDECGQDDQRKHLLPLLHLLAGHGISLFVTSRPHPEDIQYFLLKAPKIELSAKEEDIRVYIQQRIHENPRAKRLVGEGKCKDKLISELANCAKGMFLQARFHIDQICQKTTVRQILTELENLKDLGSAISTEGRPLDPTYDRVMDTIRKQPKSCTDLALRILSWLVKARRTLTVEELREVVSVEPGQYELDKWSLPDRTTLLDVCAGLVTIDENSNTIRLAHYTVQEYLLRNRILPENADLIVATACTTYLSFDIFAQDDCAFDDIVESHPFLKYAAGHLLVHLKACDHALTTDILLAFFEKSSSRSLHSCLERLDLMYDYAHDTFYTQLELPLHAASGIGHYEAVRLLLENGHDPSELDEYKRTALHVTASQGYKEVVRLLLEEGVDTSIRDDEGMTALHAATTKGHKEVVQLLLENGADISIQDDQLGLTALHMAICRGNHELVQLLLDRGSNILASDDLGRTALHEAAFGGHCGILKLLLGRVVADSDISIQDDLGQTALHLAARYHDEAVRLLLDHMVEADILIQDNKGFTVLHTAANRGRLEVTKLLLENINGGSISIPDKKGFTALHTAACGGHVEIVKLLLDRGADFTILDSERQTALQRAVSRNQHQVVQLLLGHGADIPIPDLLNSMILEEAVAAGGSREAASGGAAHLGYKALDRVFEMVKLDMARSGRAIQQTDLGVQSTSIVSRCKRSRSDEAPEQTEHREGTPNKLRTKREAPTTEVRMVSRGSNGGAGSTTTRDRSLRVTNPTDLESQCINWRGWTNQRQKTSK